MPTIAEQLTQLQNEKEDLVDNLVAKGVSASSSETFTTLVPKVLNIPSGGSSWNLLYTTEVTTSTTDTTAETLTTISPGASASTADKIIWVRVRDKAGKREGYFFGSDTIFFNPYKANGTYGTLASRMNITHYYVDGWQVQVSSGGTGYGVYAYNLSNSQTSSINLGDIQIRQRYHQSYSRTIDGTYKIEVFALDYASGETLYK